MATVGYRRVSTHDQKLERQDIGDLDRVFEEHESGSKRDRPALQDLLGYIRDGDEVVVWSIDRLARDLRDLQNIVEQVTDIGARINSSRRDYPSGTKTPTPLLNCSSRCLVRLLSSSGQLFASGKQRASRKPGIGVSTKAANSG